MPLEATKLVVIFYSSYRKLIHLVKLPNERSKAVLLFKHKENPPCLPKKVLFCWHSRHISFPSPAFSLTTFFRRLEGKKIDIHTCWEKRKIVKLDSIEMISGERGHLGTGSDNIYFTGFFGLPQIGGLSWKKRHIHAVKLL